MVEALQVPETESETGPLLRLEGLAKYFDVSPPFLNRVLQGGGRLILKAVDGITLEIPKGKTFSLVGESGCGKSTVARLVVGLYRPTRGRITFEGVDMQAEPVKAAEGYQSRPGFANFAADGSYTARTGTSDGLVPGEYQVSVECWKAPPNMEGKPVISYLP